MSFLFGARCSSVVRSFAHGAMSCRIDSGHHHTNNHHNLFSYGEPIELLLVPASASVTKAGVCAILSVWGGGGAYKRSLAANRKE